MVAVPLSSPAGALAADSGASDSASLLALTTYVYPVVQPPALAGASWCLETNLSCAQGPWWQERTQLQQADLAQFSFLEPGLATEQRYAEAIRLLWLWPEGQFLVHQAALHGVAVVTWPDAYSSNSLASYMPRHRVVRLNGRFAGSPTWMLAGVLAHELKH